MIEYKSIIRWRSNDVKPSVMIDYAPAYEFLVSLRLYGERSRWKSMDLGPAWGADADKRLGPEGKALLKQTDPIHDIHPLFLLAHKAPGERTPEAFMDWLASLSPGEIYEGAFCRVDEEVRRQTPADLEAWRDQLLPRLRLWHERYYRHLDPAIAQQLVADAEARRSQAAAASALELVFEATNGLYLDRAEHDQIILVPQYHMRPWNVIGQWQSLRLCLYPIEPAQANPDDPSMALTRITRALSDENRLRILRFLSQAPASLNDLTDRTRLAKSTVHHHMVMLRAAGLVILHEKDREGRYSLRPGWLDLVSSRLSGFIAPQ